MVAKIHIFNRKFISTIHAFSEKEIFQFAKGIAFCNNCAVEVSFNTKRYIINPEIEHPIRLNIIKN